MTTAIRQPRTFRSSALVAGLLVATCLAVAPSVALAVAPASPTLTATSPASPADDTSPEVIGMAEAGSTVRIYTDPTCIAGSLVGSGSAGAFASSGITATVASNSTTTFYATATNMIAESSDCSTPSSIVYVEAPSPPVVVDTDPPPPAADLTPLVRGTAEAGTTVYLYREATCAGAFIGVGSAAAFASTGISVIVGAKSSTTVWAKALNASNTPSACSTTSVTYTHQPTKPPAPVFADSDPDSPANANIPHVKGSAVAGGIVQIYTNPSCNEPHASEGTSAAFASPGIQTAVVNDTTTVLYARVLDDKNTASLCSTSSLTYVEDSTAPETTIVSGPDGTVPANATVRFELSASEPGSRFECHLHDPGFQPCASPATFPARASGSSATTAQLQVRAIDRAGNEDATPAARSYAIGAAPVPPAPPGGCTLRVVAISGTPAANTLNGTARSDVLLGKAGNDLLRGLAGNDCLYGEAGNDRLRGGSGADRLFGGPGADRLEGESGNDRMSGAAGNDRLTDRSGRDSFSGGIGNDTIDSRDTSAAGRRVRDTVTCGSGRLDRVIADRRDAVARDCERISRR